MNRIFTLLSAIILLCLPGAAQEIPFIQADYDQRKENLMTSSLASYNVNNIVIQAYKGLPVDQATLDYIISRALTEGEFDFNLVHLVRLLYFTNGEYESQLLPVIQSIPLLLTPNEKVRVYWSENHLCMWMSSAYLLKQKYGIDNDPELENKLNHFLDLKIQYGFYEFFSSVYFPYTLSGLLNLADFAEDPVIRQKATLAAERLLKEVLMVTNDKGVFYPTAGRNYSGKYETPYGQNHSNLIYILTGMGEYPGSASHAGAALLTSTFDPKPVVESWKSKEDRILKIGHSLQEGFTLNSVLQPYDKTIFQWSSGAYFHPDVALETATLMNAYNLWDHEQFGAYSIFRGVPVQLAPEFARIAGSISRSSVICGQDVAIFKNKNVTLNSVQDYYKGRAGYQQFPWAANSGTISAYTSSGDARGLNGNSTLPYVEQKSNVALIMYRANKDLGLFGFDKHDITLKWEDSKYDEVTYEGQWILGREGDGYVAVLRHCTDAVDGVYTCDDQDGQLWGVIVGNSDMYGSFEQFKQIVAQSRHEERWILDTRELKWIYYGMIDIDGQFIEHYWEGDIFSGPSNPVTGIQDLNTSADGFNLFPNPAKGLSLLTLTKPIVGAYTIRIHDITGREVYNSTQQSGSTQQLLLDTQKWSSGLYTVMVQTNDGTMSRKLIVQ